MMMMMNVSCVPNTEKGLLRFIPTSSTPNSATPNDGGGKENSLYFTNFMGVVKSKCLSCHSSDINGNFALLQTESAWLNSGFITSGDIFSSSLYLSLKDANAGGTMPKNLPALSTSEIKIVKDWIENVQVNNSGFTGISVRMGNRNYVNSVINHVFGKSNTTAVQGGVKYKTLSEKKILYNLSSFQGSCDIYSVRVNSLVSLTINRPPDLNDDWCPNAVNRAGDVTTPIIGRTNSIRHGFLTQVCEGQVDHVPSLDYALTTHHGWVSGDLPLTNQNLEKAFQSFYPEKPIPDVFRTALLGVASTTANNKDKWKWIYLTICLSSEWQVP